MSTESATTASLPPVAVWTRMLFSSTISCFSSTSFINAHSCASVLRAVAMFRHAIDTGRIFYDSSAQWHVIPGTNTLCAALRPSTAKCLSQRSNPLLSLFCTLRSTRQICNLQYYIGRILGSTSHDVHQTLHVRWTYTQKRPLMVAQKRMWRPVWLFLALAPVGWIQSCLSVDFLRNSAKYPYSDIVHAVRDASYLLWITESLNNSLCSWFYAIANVQILLCLVVLYYVAQRVAFVRITNVGSDCTTKAHIGLIFRNRARYGCPNGWSVFWSKSRWLSTTI